MAITKQSRVNNESHMVQDMRSPKNMIEIKIFTKISDRTRNATHQEIVNVSQGISRDPRKIFLL